MSGPRRVMLIGMMGVGKTTVGRLLARRLGATHLDSDEQVQASTGRTIPEIFAESGEAAFRAEEAKALVQAVTGDVPVVVSVAGGAVLDPDNRARIRQAGTVVWLQAPVTELAHRVGDGSGRPLLGDDPGAALAQLAAQREPIYRQLADVIVDAAAGPPDVVVDRIVELLP